MQNPDDGALEQLKSLADPKRKGKEHWPIYELGEAIRFRGWWWEITAINDDGSISVKPTHHASKNDIELLEQDLKRLRKKARATR